MQQQTPDDGLDLVGETIADRYRVEELLGTGGMGSVYKARHLALEKPVAIKLLHPHLGEDEAIGKRFDREALSSSKLEHPGCVQVLDFGTTARGAKYLVMQYLEGVELRTMTGVPMDAARVVDFGVQILEALDHAHRRGMVHRDLKPENIFVVRDDDGSERTKLVDFGIVKLLDAEGHEKLTRAGMAFGTPRYMAPEQAAGGEIDARTDIYAVGVILYELLSGLPPFDSEEPGILLRQHIMNPPPALPPEVPPKLAAVVMERFLAKKVRDRPATAAEAAKLLAGALEPDEATSAPEPVTQAVQAPPNEIVPAPQQPFPAPPPTARAPASIPHAPARPPEPQRLPTSALPRLPSGMELSAVSFDSGAEAPAGAVPPRAATMIAQPPAVASGVPARPASSSRSTSLVVAAVSLLGGGILWIVLATRFASGCQFN